MSKHPSVAETHSTSFVQTPAADQALYAQNAEPAIEGFSPVQCKLTVGSPDDPMEEEADAIADKVMRMPEPISVQRKCSGCEDEEQAQRKPLGSFVQRVSAGSARTVSNETASGISAAQGAGSSLPQRTKSFMESRFGNDFSAVRIHSGSEAAQLSRDLNAQAFTVGNDVFFNQGKFAPDTEDGGRLLAHELTHTIQQSAGSVQNKLVQRDLAVEPTVADPQLRQLTDVQIRSAIRFNQLLFRDEAEIAEIRDVLGASREPSVIDEDFVQMLVTYQADFGLTQDGKLGAGTAGRLATEITAEADFLGEPPTGTPLRRTARRLRLRATVPASPGSIAHQGFVGPDADPDGVVTVRTGANFSATNPGLTSAITHDYTGRNADNVRWLQFLRIHMSAVQPGSTTPVFNTGTVSGCGAGSSISQTWSPPTAPVWGVDSCSATDPFYDGSFTFGRTPGVSIIIADQPFGFLPTAQAFAATLTPAPTTVTATFHFDSYAVRSATTPLYHNRWTSRLTFDITAGTIASNTITNQGGGSISRLSTEHKTSVDTNYPGNTVR